MTSSTELQISGLLPLPLRDRLGARASDIWQRELRFVPGERTFIQAPSGTGKTTLIHILYGLRNDYEGRVQWNGALLSAQGPEAVAALRQNSLSVIFQDMRLFPALSAWENLEIKRTLTDTVSQEQVRQWLAHLGIADRAERPASTLSYGEQQRVAIIRALVQPFSWLLMDEPFSHLDAANTQRAAELIAGVVEEREASFLIADLDDNSYFNYDKKLLL
jgi:ABC-type lipoprotein export system ATPase subunit